MRLDSIAESAIEEGLKHRDEDREPVQLV